MDKSNLLRFVKGGNAKLDEDIWSFSLPAGWSCPGAEACMTKVSPETGKLIDGARQKFRCFAAVNETRPNVRAARWYNFQLLTSAGNREAMFDLICASFPKKVKTLRIHVSGDFFSLAYFGAWCDVARKFTATEFYAYTKSLNHVSAYLRREKLPKNLKLTLSDGGKWDALMDEVRALAEESSERNLGVARVVFHPDEAGDLPIDHDDSHARSGDHEFALLLHAQQPADSDAAEAIKRMRKEGIGFSYPANKKKTK